MTQELPVQLVEPITKSTKYFGVDPKVKSAKRRVVNARMMVINYLIRNLGVSNATICDIFNIKHTLVIYYLNRHEELVVSDNVYRDTYIAYKSFLFN
jgi:hypothetical protein